MSEATATKRFPLSPVGRVSFHALFVPDSMDEKQEKKYGVTLIFPKSSINSPEFKAMVKAAEELCDQEFKCSLKGGPGKKIKTPFNDGATKSHLDGYGDDVIYVRFSGLIAPAVVGPDKKLIAPDARPEQGGVYNGCYGRVSYKPYFYKHPLASGIGLGLINFQKTGDGEMFGFGGSNPDEDFDVVEGFASDSDNDVGDIL